MCDLYAGRAPPKIDENFSEIHQEFNFSNKDKLAVKFVVTHAGWNH